MATDSGDARHRLVRYLVMSLLAGIVFAALDGVLNANPVAVAALTPFAAIVRPSINIFAGVGVDLAYGFALTGLFLLLSPSLPGRSALTKGLSFGLLVWFLRVVTNVMGQWVLFVIPLSTVGYMAAAGLVQMLALGALLGVTLKLGGGRSDRISVNRP